MSNRFKMISKKGHDCSEVISAIQKCIRRGEERDALYWAVELYDSGYAEWLWKRLRIISSEDVGMAEPNISSEIWALYSMHVIAAKNKEDKGEPQRLFMAHAVLKLCRAKKSRLVDWALIWAWLTHPHESKLIPDVALDKHTERGRLKKRSWHHFFTEGTILKPHENQLFEEEYRDLASAAISNPNGVDLFSSQE